MDVNLPPDLDEWLESRADQIGVEPELLLHQLVDSYRTSEPDEQSDRERNRLSENQTRDMNAAVVESLLDEKLDEWIAEDLEDAIDARVEQSIQEELGKDLEAWITNEVEAETTSVENRLRERIDALEQEQTESLQDVRDRVIQVKKEADNKTSQDRHRETQAELEALRADIFELEEKFTGISERVAELAEKMDRIDDLDSSIEDLGSDLDRTDERLNTLAWNVNEIRDYVDTATDLSPVLQKAAQLDISRAKCDNCAAAVEVGLLTEPECPHCSATLTGIVDSRSFFGKPRLLVSDGMNQ